MKWAKCDENERMYEHMDDDIYVLCVCVRENSIIVCYNVHESQEITKLIFA